MRRAVFAAALGLLLPPLAAAGPAVALTPVKLAAFREAVAKHKGKVVVIDFWATYCVPCMKEFHNLVELHKQYGDKGLVCVSVTVDENDDATKARALKFLTKQGAAFENYLLDESPDDWSKELKFGNVPAVLVFGKDGKLAKKFWAEDNATAFDYGDVRKFLKTLLAGD